MSICLPCTVSCCNLRVDGSSWPQSNPPLLSQDLYRNGYNWTQSWVHLLVRTSEQIHAPSFQMRASWVQCTSLRREKSWRHQLIRRKRRKRNVSDLLSLLYQVHPRKRVLQKAGIHPKMHQQKGAWFLFSVLEKFCITLLTLSNHLQVPLVWN